MKRISLFLLLCWAMLTASAQELKVKSMNAVSNDLTASVEHRLDLNGNPCALVRVIINDSYPQFQGNVIGSVKKDGKQFLVYLSEGTQMLRIIPADSYPIRITFADYGIKAVKAKTTYDLILVDAAQLAQELADTPPTLSADGPNEMNLGELTANIFGIPSIKHKEKFKKAKEEILKFYPEAKIDEDSKMKVIALDASCGYDKTLLGQPVTAKATWISTLGFSSVTTSYSIVVRTKDKQFAIDAAIRLKGMLEAKGFRAEDPSGYMKMAASGTEYTKILKQGNSSLMLSVSEISTSNYFIQLSSM